ncbi:MAG: RluA family pseudouridine synthase [Lachnospiraceae bacterium]|nr:RluA family pseudouridine synthase [Lachnospiraceae bacterium]
MNRELTYNLNDEENKTIIAFLKEKGYSIPILQNLKSNPADVLLDGEPGFLNRIIKNRINLTVMIRETQKSDYISSNIPLDILFEDDDLIIINKAANMPIHPSINHQEGTLANALTYYYRNESSPFIYRCLNRLDKNTTGITVVAKNPLSSAILSQQMKNDNIHRTYYAVVSGIIDSPGVINAPIARASNSIITREVNFKEGQEAITEYEPLKVSGNSTLIKCTLKTGRTHQIRVHMSYIGHPLVGDFLYGNTDKTSVSGRQLLHAGEIAFTHPITGDKMLITAPLPEDFGELRILLP